MGKVGPLTAARKPASSTTRPKSNPKRSQPLEQVSANPDMTYEVRKYINRIIINIFFLSNSDLL